MTENEKKVEEKTEKKSLARTESYFRISYVNPSEGETHTDIIETEAEWEAYQKTNILELRVYIRNAKERKRKAKLRAKAEKLLEEANGD